MSLTWMRRRKLKRPGTWSRRSRCRDVETKKDVVALSRNENAAEAKSVGCAPRSPLRRSSWSRTNSTPCINANTSSKFFRVTLWTIAFKKRIGTRGLFGKGTTAKSCAACKRRGEMDDSDGGSRRKQFAESVDGRPESSSKGAGRGKSPLGAFLSQLTNISQTRFVKTQPRAHAVRQTVVSASFFDQWY